LILGIGIDIVDLKRFSGIAENKKFRENFFSETESQLNTLSLAGRFASREALYKAVGSQGLFDWKDIEVVNTESGAPKFIFRNTALKFFESKKVHLSISHVPEYAISFVIIESE
jgi:holo-[acyl-carrier protein] synthase